MILFALGEVAVGNVDKFEFKENKGSTDDFFVNR